MTFQLAALAATLLGRGPAPRVSISHVPAAGGMTVRTSLSFESSHAGACP